MAFYCIYDKKTGEIKSCPNLRHDPDGVYDMLEADEDVLDLALEPSFDQRLKKVDVSLTVPTLVDRTEMPAVIDKMTIDISQGESVIVSNITPNAIVWLYYENCVIRLFTFTDPSGQYEIEPDAPGSYRVKLTSNVDLDINLEFEAVE